MPDTILTDFTVVKVLTDTTFISDTDDRSDTTTIACYSYVCRDRS